MLSFKPSQIIYGISFFAAKRFNNFQCALSVPYLFVSNDPKIQALPEIKQALEDKTYACFAPNKKSFFDNICFDVSYALDNIHINAGFLLPIKSSQPTHVWDTASHTPGGACFGGYKITCSHASLGLCLTLPFSYIAFRTFDLKEKEWSCYMLTTEPCAFTKKALVSPGVILTSTFNLYTNFDNFSATCGYQITCATREKIILQNDSRSIAGIIGAGSQFINPARTIRMQYEALDQPINQLLYSGAAITPYALDLESAAQGFTTHTFFGQLGYQSMWGFMQLGISYQLWEYNTASVFFQITTTF